MVEMSSGVVQNRGTDGVVDQRTSGTSGLTSVECEAEAFASAPSVSNYL
jgi:hypothetical protein